MDTTTPTPPEPESLAVLHEQDARELRVLLLDMAKDGAILAKLYVQQAQDQAYATTPGKGPSPECAAAYNGVSRAVRRTVMLVQKLTEPAPVAKADRTHTDKIAARKQVIRRVEDAIHADAPAEEAEQLQAEFLERLEGAEFDDEFGQRPVQEIVNEIRADLGIHGPGSLDHFKRRTPADAALLCARADAPGRVGRGAPFGVARPACGTRPNGLDPAGLVAALLQRGAPIRGP